MSRWLKLLYQMENCYCVAIVRVYEEMGHGKVEVEAK